MIITFEYLIPGANEPIRSVRVDLDECDVNGALTDPVSMGQAYAKQGETCVNAFKAQS